MGDRLSRCRLILTLGLMMLLVQVAAAQETAARAVTLDDWNRHTSGLVLGLVLVAIVSILFGALAVRRSRKPN